MTSTDEPSIVCAEIGNSDDKLTQARWAAFCQDTDDIIRFTAARIFGVRYSEPASEYQNACWHFTIRPSEAGSLKAELAENAAEYQQESIAWSQITQTEMLTP